MIKQITTYLNLKNKYGFKEGTYLFGMRYCNRKKYYDLIIKKITREFHDEIVAFKSNIGNFYNYPINRSGKCKIWVLWFQGYSDMPELIKKCYKSLLNNADSKKYEVILLDKNNINDYINIPEHIKVKFQSKKISYTHLSDSIRMLLLSQYGGIWIDSTCYFIKKMDEDILNFAFFSSKNEKNKSHFFNEGKWSTYFMAAGEKNCVPAFLNYMFTSYWKKNDYLCDYFLLDIFMEIGYREIDVIRDLVDRVPINNDNPMIVLDNWNKKINNRYENIINNSLFVKLNWRIDGRYKKGTVGEYINDSLHRL